MGRSVWTHSDAIDTVFFDTPEDYFCLDCDIAADGPECPECATELVNGADEAAWDDLIEDIQFFLINRFPSFSKADRWPERESHCILDNYLCDIVISEYCGLVSLGVVPTGMDDYEENTTGLAHAWCEKNVVPFVYETWGQLQRLGTMSNGESVYTEAGRAV